MEDQILKLTEASGHIRGRVDGIKDDVSEIKSGQQKMIDAFNAHITASEQTHGDIRQRQSKMEIKLAFIGGSLVLVARELIAWASRHIHL